MIRLSGCRTSLISGVEQVASALALTLAVDPPVSHAVLSSERQHDHSENDKENERMKNKCVTLVNVNFSLNVIELKF